MIEEYRAATDEEKQGVCSEDYDLLIGPEGFQCFLGEREDRTWNRDARKVVDLLNSQRKEIDHLREMIEVDDE